MEKDKNTGKIHFLLYFTSLLYSPIPKIFLSCLTNKIVLFLWESSNVELLNFAMLYLSLTSNLSQKCHFSNLSAKKCSSFRGPFGVEFHDMVPKYSSVRRIFERKRTRKFENFQDQKKNFSTQIKSGFCPKI